MMMEDSMEQKIKQKLLESLIEHMHDKMGSDLEAKFPKKAMEVSVAAPDKGHLMDGLEKAKDVTDELPPGDGEPDGMDAAGEGSDEDRLMALLEDDKDDEGDEDELRG